MATSSQKILADIIKTQDEYATIYRKVTNLPRFTMAVDQGLLKKDDWYNEVVRESVLEHIGHLPMLATVIYPHLENKDKVNLGKSLLYLALHEAPERITGDKFRLDKTDQDEEDELEAARKIFTGVYQPYFKLYEDFHFLKNIDAQFAVSVDKIAPFIYFELNDHRIRHQRWQKLGATIKKNRDKNIEFMTWDKTMNDLFEYVLQDIQNYNDKNSFK